ncbi:MAG TPA: hypothetical protein VHY91_22645 [Pirellulales bacterium]|jgi:Skp family chaperone for outer membrane proteins|nr:hypothetical protein [Pirellulales bacterium]
MRKFIAISTFAAIAALAPLAAFADAIPPTGRAVPANATNEAAGSNDLDAWIRALARQEAKLRMDLELATKNLKAALAAADPKSRSAINAKRLLKQVEEQTDETTSKIKRRMKQLEDADDGQWHYLHEWRIVPL